MAFVNEKTTDGKWQTIDKEKKIILSYDGGRGSGTAFAFVLHYYGFEIPLVAQRKIAKAQGALSDVTWDVVQIHIPDDALEKKPEIINAIEEAMEECGFLFSRKNVNDVSVNFKTLDI